jgi:hypothetical protein
LPVPLISAKFLGDDEQAGRIAVKTGKTKAPKRPEPNAPTGWLTVEQALSWIAARSLAPNWDVAFYFGAATWFSQSPDEALEHLRQMIAEPPGSLFRATRYGPDFEERVRTAVVDLDLRGDDGAAHPQTIDIDGITGRLVDHLSAHLQDARAQHDRLQQAADMLRQAIASGELAAYGWKGELSVPSDLMPSIADARERIPPDACAGPVTVTGIGILPVTNDEVRRVIVTPAWSGIMIRADNLVRLWPSASTSLQSAVAGPQAANNTAPDAETQQARRPQFDLPGLRLWFHNRFTRWPSNASYPTELEDWQAAQSDFEGHVPRGAIREMRKKFAPENWRKSGPRKPR